jgi:hypothetical protein
MAQCLICGSENAEVSESQHPIMQIQCPICGLYAISDLVVRMKLLEQERDRIHLVSAYTRQMSDLGKPVTITTENLPKIFDSVPKFSSPLDNINLTLLLIMKRQTRADDYVNLNITTDYPLVYAHDSGEYLYFKQTLIEQGLIEDYGTHNQIGTIRLTPAGWQRALELEKIQVNSDQAFVAMWFDPGLDAAWEQGIKPALESTGFKPYRVDRDPHNEKIDDRIISEIRRSGLLVADFTGHRGGVYFEAGFAMGLGIPVIWTCREDNINNAHFDTRQYNHVTWKDPAELKEKLALRIAATIPGRIVKQ